MGAGMREGMEEGIRALMGVGMSKDGSGDESRDLSRDGCGYGNRNVSRDGCQGCRDTSPCPPPHILGQCCTLWLCAHPSQATG